MASKLHSHYGYGSLFLNISIATLTKAQKRWRLAYITIYCSRAMLSLTREIVANKKRDNGHQSGILPSQSNTVLDIEPISSHDDVHEIFHGSHKPKRENLDGSDFARVDQSKLTEMVQHKNLNELGKFGGVEGLVTALSTDPERGIKGDDHDVSQRSEMFGSNTYHKPPPKPLIHFVLEVFKDTTILILLACAALSLGFGIKEHGAQEGWYEGGSIFVAVFLVVAISGPN